MLKENPEERPTAEELLELPWFEVSLSYFFLFHWTAFS
jgi:hypothetical protein